MEEREVLEWLVLCSTPWAHIRNTNSNTISLFCLEIPWFSFFFFFPSKSSPWRSLLQTQGVPYPSHTPQIPKRILLQAQAKGKGVSTGTATRGPQNSIRKAQVHPLLFSLSFSSSEVWLEGEYDSETMGCNPKVWSKAEQSLGVLRFLRSENDGKFSVSPQVWELEEKQLFFLIPSILPTSPLVQSIFFCAKENAFLVFCLFVAFYTLSLS